MKRLQIGSSLFALSVVFTPVFFGVKAAGTAILSESEAVAPLKEIPFHKGVNVNAWFDIPASNVDLNKYKASEFENLKRLGMDVVRLPINFHSNVGPAPDYKLDEGYLSNLDEAVNRITGNGLWVILDHHSLSTEAFPADGEALITSCCRQLALRYKGRDNVALELFNEPFREELKELWPTMQGRIIKAVRACDPNLIIVATGWGCYPKNLKELPEYNDPRVVYTFHYYDPIVFTHQLAYWDENLGKLSGYPFPYDASRMPEIHQDWQKEPYLTFLYNSYPEMATANQIRKDISELADWALQQGKLLFCGEFGALNTSEPADRYRWYKAIGDVLKEKNIPWTLWQYHDDQTVNFSIFKGNRYFRNLDTEMLEALGITIPEDPGYPENLWIYGDATPGGWDLEKTTPMENLGNGIYRYVGELKSGSPGALQIYAENPKVCGTDAMAFGQDEPCIINCWGVSNNSINYYDKNRPGSCYYQVQEGQTNNYILTVDVEKNTIDVLLNNLYLVGVPTEWKHVQMKNEGNRIFSYKGYFAKESAFAFTTTTDWSTTFAPANGDVSFGLSDFSDNTLQFGKPYTMKNEHEGHYIVYADLNNNTLKTRTYNPDPIEKLYVFCDGNYNEMDPLEDGTHIWCGDLSEGFVITTKTEPYPCYMPGDEIVAASANVVPDGKMVFNITAANNVDKKWIVGSSGVYTVKVNPSAMSVSVVKGTTTGIDSVTFIGNDTDTSEFYNLLGRKVQNPAKGIYISINGGKSQKIIIN